MAESISTTRRALFSLALPVIALGAVPLAALAAQPTARDAWDELREKNHPGHADWPACIAHARRAGLGATEIWTAVLAQRGPRQGRLFLCVKGDDRLITATGFEP